MSKEKYSLYDFPELLYNSKLLTNRQRCIVLCLFSFLNLKGGGAFSIDILAEKTGIRKDHIYCELKQLPFIRREGKKISLDIDKLKEFITTKLGSSNKPNKGLKKTQNGSKEDPKQVLERPNIGLSKTQNGSKKSPEAQASQSPDGTVNNISRKDYLDKNLKENIREEKKEVKNQPAEQKPNGDEKEERKENLEEKEITPSLISLVVQQIINAFKTEYKRRFNRYPLIDTASIKRVEKALLNSAANQEELKDLANQLIQKVPDFFKFRDKWIIDKGYSFFAFSYRVTDLTSQPVSYQVTNTPNVKFACKGGWR
ncbi:hypothetical protein SAMN06269117_11449 [Balnearium lithotrophicum]|uniref:Uncharacterized protein n=1 Tax=Balnearium lithotrophicum TaxID=223788 RepID=A0A521CQC8_9BACT|nr:hypothetical protein [Balnearium lithotrophicum]SMO61633.1 hypothetical protein SAMN06269117_11449 [Balnearium lithotrophicum]